MVVAKCEVAGRVSVAGRQKQRQTTLGPAGVFPFASFLLSSLPALGGSAVCTQWVSLLSDKSLRTHSQRTRGCLPGDSKANDVDSEVNRYKG